MTRPGFSGPPGGAPPAPAPPAMPEVGPEVPACPTEGGVLKPNAALRRLPMPTFRPTSRPGGVARTLACVLLGAAALTATAFYAAPLLNTPGSQPSSSSSPPAEKGRVAIGFGHVDVEEGMGKLSPLSPGRVTKIP